MAEFQTDHFPRCPIRKKKHVRSVDYRHLAAKYNMDNEYPSQPGHRGAVYLPFQTVS